MQAAQTGIFALGTRAHEFLEYTLRPSASDEAVRSAIGTMRDCTAGLDAHVVVAFGSRALPRVCPQLAALVLADAVAIHSPTRSAPATPRDIWVWVHADGPDAVFDAVRTVQHALEPVAEVTLDQPGFVYRDSRDLTGFIDGTENPEPAQAPEVAVLASGQLGAAGGFVMSMRWLHDLDAFGALSVADQERVIGRTKQDSVELSPIPADAHIARVVIEEDGDELEIYRRSVPFGDATEQGLYFVAFSAEPQRFERMLARMFGTAGDGLHDHLTDFSRPVTNARWFAPASSDLDAAVGPAAHSPM